MVDKNELKKKLSPEQYRITQEKGTEVPFTGEYLNKKEDGIYHCVVCDNELFDSSAKFDSGTGWPSFTNPTNLKNISLKEDLSHGMKRTEVTCKNCGAHLGHIFPDGPEPKGERYCINSCALDFKSNRLKPDQNLGSKSQT